MDTEITDVKKEDVAKVTVQLPDESYTISRKDGDIALTEVPEGKQQKDSEVEGVFGALSYVSFNKVLPADQVDAKWDATYTSVLKEEKHRTYTIQLAKADDKPYIRVAAQGPSDEMIEQSRRIRKDAPKEELEQKDAVLTAADEADAFTAKHKGWAYEISDWKAKKLRKPLEKLIEDIPEPDEPEEVSARHILIAFKGSERAGDDVTRSKDEAKALAEKVLKEAKAEDADFAALAKKYSDGPSATKGGDLGLFKKGKMHENFEKAAWKLDVDEISGVVETPFGFHIIQRTK
jgi:parvulin-like peptidyl-prolyl isomerase